MSGFVYFIGCADRVKIGYSEDPAKRLTKINADSPWPCELLGYVNADDFPESEVHQRFASVRLHSEWFALTAEIRAFVETAKVSQKQGLDRFERTDLTDASPLKKWRILQKLSQKQAAELLAVSLVTWNQWETGRANVPGPRCLAVESITGVSRHVLRPDVFGVSA